MVMVFIEYGIIGSVMVACLGLIVVLIMFSIEEHGPWPVVAIGVIFALFGAHGVYLHL